MIETTPLCIRCECYVREHGTLCQRCKVTLREMDTVRYQEMGAWRRDRVALRLIEEALGA